MVNQSLIMGEHDKKKINAKILRFLQNKTKIVFG